MKRIITRVLSLILVICMLAGMSISVSAASPTPYSGMSSQYKSSVYYQRLMNVNLGENQIENLINVAHSQVGYTEGSNSGELAGANSTGEMKNYTEYGKRLGKSGYAWCCAFVNWCIYMAGIPGDVMPNRHAGCSNFIQSLVYNYGGTFHSSSTSYKPQAGDIIFYEGSEIKNDANGIPKISGHVGIVVEDYNASTGKFGVIEGNGPGYVQFNHQPLYRKGNFGNYILGYVTPAYTSGTESQQGLVVRLTTPTQTNYVNKQFITETNACVVTQIYKSAGSNITKSGLVLMNADGSLIKRHTEDITGIVGKNTTVFHSWYDINKEIGITLSPATTYKYRFFAVVDGITFEGDTYTFTTKGNRTSYTVYFDANGGSVSPTSKTVYSGDIIGTLPDPILEGYDFQGWYTSPSGGTIISANTKVNLTGDTTFYAHWTEAEVDEDIIPVSITISKPGNAEYAAKEFVGETNACLVTEVVKTGGSVASEVGIYLMDANGTLIKKGSNNLTGVISAESTCFYTWYNANEHLGITLAPDTTYTYRFYTIVDGKTYEGDTYSFTTLARTSYTATFYSGLDYSAATSIKVTEGQPYGALPSPTVPEGYNFLGWYTTKTSGTRVTETTLFAAGADISLYAHYEKIPAQVTLSKATEEEYASKEFVGETNACFVTAVTKSAGSVASEVGIYLMDANGKLIETGYNDLSGVIPNDSTGFYTWYDMNEHLGITLSPGTTYSYRFYTIVDGKTYEGETYSFTTLAPTSFKASFYSGLDFSTISTVTVTKGEAFGPLPTPIVPGGYNFLGWYTAKEGGELISESTVFSANADISLYARYERISKNYSFSYDSNGGIGSMGTQNLSYGENITIKHNAFTNPGFEFSSWILRRDADGKYYTDNGWQSYSDAAQKNYKLAVFDGGSNWIIDDAWTTGCEDARDFTFVAVWNEVEETPLVNPFVDVNTNDYFYDSVLWAVDNNVTTGTSANTFSPSKPCTRAQVVTFLWRAMGSPTPSSSYNPFKDVSSGDYYYNAVLWAVEKGITNGLSADSFGSDKPCTRAQVATFLWRTVGKPGSSMGYSPFTDVASGDYYFDAVLWAVENGVTTGISPTQFGPGSQCSRAQIVTFLFRALEK